MHIYDINCNKAGIYLRSIFPHCSKLSLRRRSLQSPGKMHTLNFDTAPIRYRFQELVFHSIGHYCTSKNNMNKLNHKILRGHISNLLNISI